ncbi:DNA primase [compost metagenome]
MLHHPELAQNVEDVSHFAAEDDTYTQLLVALLGALQKNPKLRALQLLARWHGTEQGRLLRALAEKEWLISADNLEQQFFDTITSLVARQRERSLEHLINKARQSELSAEEKNQLRNLLSRNASPVIPSPTGA